MQFDAELHRCALIIDRELPAGLAMNAASVTGVSFGRALENLVGSALQSQDGVTFPGLITAPLPVLMAAGDRLAELHRRCADDESLFVLPFSALAQSCRSYGEYEARLRDTASSTLALVALGLAGPKKTISRLTGDLKLYS
ncbi:DUF2000 domain-containing protein [Pantoea sp. KPR_PJ]|uniref:DUF2000 domain-containing protein n=1 Tax=Pantoea sp. KPR_PJ TaxID=2738375 RepID=UPI0035277414